MTLMSDKGSSAENEVLEKVLVKQELAFRKARRSLWAYAQLKNPDFYKRDRDFLRELCNSLQMFVESEDDEVLLINMPPRHGKSFTGTKFVEWCLGVDPSLKIMTGSYNETLSTTFSRSVRNTIMEQKADMFEVVYSDIFPETRINRGHSSVNLWGIEGEPYSYLATSPSGTATGFGANLLIVDDLIKNANEAFNDRVLNEHWEWFTQTMLSRLEEGGKIVIVMTRWNNNDLAGRALRHFKGEGKNIVEVKMKAMQDDGSMLCDDILSKESYLSRVKAIGKEVSSANYQQEPLDIRGRLYTGFKTYEDVPKDENGNPLFNLIISYTDTADQGDDNLCSIVAGVYQGRGYVLDIYYTKDPMEVTEPETASFLVRNKANIAVIESNSGGRGFARNVERHIWEDHETRAVQVVWFHQNMNKKARIISNSTFVMNNILFPVGWEEMFPDYYDAMISYQREGRNEHDDAPDTTTGLAELISDDIELVNESRERTRARRSSGNRRSRGRRR